MQSTSLLGGGDPALRPVVPPRPRPPSRSTGGFSLIEVLVALVARRDGGAGPRRRVAVLVRIDDDTAQRQRVEHGLNNYAEGLRSLDYRDCAAAPDNASTANYAADAAASPLSWTPPAGMDVEITGMRYWDASGRQFVDACAGGDGGAQELTVGASRRGRTATGQIVLGAR